MARRITSFASWPAISRFSGGLLFRNDMWLTPKVAELDELQAWNARYAQKTAIKTAEQVAQAEKEGQKADTGVGGFLAKQLFKKAAGDPAEPRTMLLTSAHELLKVTQDAAAADVALPAGLKLK